MKQLKRFLPMLIVIALLALGPVLAAFAQGSTDPLCAGLSDSDCQILTKSQTTMSGVKSFALPSWSVSFKANAQGTDVQLDAKGSGAFEVASDGSKTAIDLKLDQVTVTSNGKTASVSGAEVMVINDMAFVLYNNQWYGQQLSASDLSSLGLGGTAGSMAGGLGAVTGMLQQPGGMSLGNLAQQGGVDLTGVVSTVRGADAQVAGKNVATFTSTIDFTKLLSALLGSPMIGQIAGSAMGGTTGGTSATPMSPQELQMIAGMLGPMFTGTTISLEQQVSPDDGYIYGIKLDVVLNMDATMFSPSTGKVAAELHVAAGLGNFNESVTLTPPATYGTMDQLNQELNKLTLQ
jgi:hypothetical protein